MFYLLISSRRKHNFIEFLFLCVKAKLLWKQSENSWNFLKISSFSWMDLRYVFPLKTLCDNFELIFLFKAKLLSKKYQIFRKIDKSLSNLHLNWPENLKQSSTSGELITTSNHSSRLVFFHQFKKVIPTWENWIQVHNKMVENKGGIIQKGR